MFSVLILTLNEARNLPRCLASLKGIDDVVVLDSGSADQTREIARVAGARVIERPFDNFASQRNYAQAHAAFRHRWIFHLDADEEMTPSLAGECASAALRTDLDAFLVAPQMMFHGRWIRHCTDYPAYQARFVRAPDFRFIQVGHGQREAPNQRLEYLRGNYVHHIPHDANAWMTKHRRYAREEAQELLRDRSRIQRTPKLTVSDSLERRRALKFLSRRLPFRGATRFFYQYVLRRGFLDGRPGLQYCLWLARYEALIAEELRSLARR